MDDQAKMIESLWETAKEYGKTNLEIIKLKTLDKSSNIISSILFNTVLFVLFISFIVFFNLGLALWIGNLLGHSYLGFFVLAGLYLLVGIIFYFFLQKWLKKLVNDFIIKQVLK